jgi:hypothetical protein
VRNKVWQVLEKQVDLGPELKSPDNYVFSSVDLDANLVEYYDYSKKLSELKLFNYFFKLVESQGNIEEKLFNSHLSKPLVALNPFTTTQNNNMCNTKCMCI